MISINKFAYILLALLISQIIHSQITPNDCINAITVCGNSEFSSTIAGKGMKQEINSCGSEEHSSIWLKITIAQGVISNATLGFDIIPDNTNLSEDYDFWVFKGPACPILGNIPIRCCTSNPFKSGALTNHTGLNSNSTDNTSGPGLGPSYVKNLIVNPGETYFICIDNAYGINGFKLIWTGTATQGQGAFPISPIPNQLQDQEMCVENLKTYFFDFNIIKPLIYSDLTNNTVTFYKSLSDALAQTNLLPDNYSNQSSKIQNIYARVTNKTTNCFGLTSFNLLIKEYAQASISIDKKNICEGEKATITITGTPNSIVGYTANNDGQQTLKLGSTGNYSFTTIPFQNTSYSLDFVIKTDNNGNLGCIKNIGNTQTITVNPLPKASIIGDAQICPQETTTIIFTGTPNSIIKYNINGNDQTITLDSSGTTNLTTPPLTTTSIYKLINVSTSSTPTCTQTLNDIATITVAPKLTATITSKEKICLGSTSTVVFSGTPNAIVTYQINNESNNEILLDSSGQASLTTKQLLGKTIYKLINIRTTSAPLCSIPINCNTTIDITNAPLINKPTDYKNCATDSQNNISCNFDLKSKDSEISTDPNVKITYHTSESDAQIGINEIPNQLYCNSTPNQQTIFTRVFDPALPDCPTLTTFNLIVKPLPHPAITSSDGTSSICIDFTTQQITKSLTLESGMATPENYKFQWLGNDQEISGENGSTYTINTTLSKNQTYNSPKIKVRVTDTTSQACQNESLEFTVKQSSMAHLPQGTLGYEVNETFSDNPTIIVNIEGYGNYQYSLDKGPKQDSNIFEHVEPGTHEITVWDNTDEVSTAGCGELIIANVLIINFPHYFTPNGDNINDTWNITSLANYEKTNIYIFDRFGKLLKQISPNNNGWDGTYNSQSLPADDYWFIVEYEDNNILKKFKSHFSLKR